MRRFRRILFHELVMVVAGALSFAAAGAQPSSPSAPVRLELLTGTVCRLDSRAGALDLLTGVGHAVRIRHVRLATDLRVKGRGAEAGISALVPGTVCRLECQVEPAGATAISVEVLQAAPVRTP